MFSASPSPQEPRANRSHQTAAKMALEGLDALPPHKVLNLIAAHIEDRPDIDPTALDALANRLGRRAHMLGRM